MWSRDGRIIWDYGWVSLIISHHPAKFASHWPGGRGDILFLICHLAICDNVSEVNLILWRGLLIISHHPTTYTTTTLPRDRRRCAREDESMWPHDPTWPRGHRIMWHHVWVSIIIRNYPTKFCGHRTCRKGAILILIEHVTLHDHVANRLCHKAYLYLTSFIYLFWPVICVSNQLIKKSTLVADSSPNIKRWTVKRTIGHRSFV